MIRPRTIAVTLGAALVYFAILFVIRVAGNVLRAFLLAPMIGHTMTMLLELPVILLIAWVSSRILILRFGMRRELGHAALMGAATFVMLILAEAALSTGLGDTFTQFLRQYGRAPGALGLLGAIVLSFFPAIQVALSRSRHR